MASKDEKNEALYAGYIIYFLVIVLAMYLVYVRISLINKQSAKNEALYALIR
jgi:hypothetical protein